MGVDSVSVAPLESNSLGSMNLVEPLGGVDLIDRSKCLNRYQINEGREART
jgi:hypothetical protein